MVVPVTVPFADTVNLVMGVAFIRFWRLVEMPARLVRSAQAVTSRPWVACLILIVITSSTVVLDDSSHQWTAAASDAGVWVNPNSATTLVNGFMLP